MCGTEGTIFTATDATNPFQSWPMAVYTNKDFSVDSLPPIRSERPLFDKRHAADAPQLSGGH